MKAFLGITLTTKKTLPSADVLEGRTDLASFEGLPAGPTKNFRPQVP